MIRIISDRQKRTRVDSPVDWRATLRPGSLGSVKVCGA